MRRGGLTTDSPVRQILGWAALTFLMAGAAGATGYLAARPTEDAAAKPPAPSLLNLGEIYRSGRAAGVRGGRKQAYARGRREGYAEGLRRGRRAGARGVEGRSRRGGSQYRRIFRQGRDAGMREALEPFGFGANGFYLVGVVRGGRRVDASHGPLRERLAYEVCRGGRAVCVTREPR